MPDLDTLLSSYEVEMRSVSYRLSHGTMDAVFHLFMAGDRFDEALHDRLLAGHDGYEDANWRIQALDTDLGDTWARCTVLLEARTPEACRILNPHVVATLPQIR